MPNKEEVEDVIRCMLILSNDELSDELLAMNDDPLFKILERAFDHDIKPPSLSDKELAPLSLTPPKLTGIKYGRNKKLRHKLPTLHIHKNIKKRRQVKKPCQNS